MPRLIATLLLSLLSTLAYAHGEGGTGGFSIGFNHPVFGLDHLLAMLSVGLISVQIGGKAIWTVPATFVGVMVIGAGLGIAGLTFNYVELGIAGSVVILGLAIALNKSLPVWAAMFGVGIFAIFHGHAHGTEMPYLVEPWLYALGFVCGTTVIHLIGIAIAKGILSIKKGNYILRICGAAIAGAGLHILLG